MKWMVILIGLMPITGWAAEFEHWELKRERDDIKVFTRDVEGSKFKQVKSQMTVPGSLSAVVSLVLDTEACSEWAALCKSAYVQEVVSPTEMYVYTYNDVPWPVTDRDAVSRVIWQQDAKTLTVTMKAAAVPGRLPETRAVRVTQATTSWEFEPLQDGFLRITSHAHIDPAGPTPAWMTNLLLVDAPFDTMRQMREILGSGRYNDKTVAFITEPSVADPAR